MTYRLMSLQGWQSKQDAVYSKDSLLLLSAWHLHGYTQSGPTADGCPSHSTRHCDALTIALYFKQTLTFLSRSEGMSIIKRTVGSARYQYLRQHDCHLSEV